MVTKNEPHVNNSEPKILSGYLHVYRKWHAGVGISSTCARIGRLQKLLQLINHNIGALEKWLKLAPMGALAAKK